mmetsp:Transcript_4360/g.10668  ORF Transcript_4360/g.10668 Transcript_4360/m.10668 type:complete len:240 (-) Transcript_4360:1766-2485(-)
MPPAHRLYNELRPLPQLNCRPVPSSGIQEDIITHVCLSTHFSMSCTTLRRSQRQDRYCSLFPAPSRRHDRFWMTYFALRHSRSFTMKYKSGYNCVSSPSGSCNFSCPSTGCFAPFPALFSGPPTVSAGQTSLPRGAQSGLRGSTAADVDAVDARAGGTSSWSVLALVLFSGSKLCCFGIGPKVVGFSSTSSRATKSPSRSFHIGSNANLAQAADPLSLSRSATIPSSARRQSSSRATAT